MKKRKTSKVKKGLKFLNFGIFPGNLLFCYNLNHFEIMIELAKLKADKWAYAIMNEQALINQSNWLALSRELVDKKTGEASKYYYIIISSNFEDIDYDYAKLAHEVLHVCQFFLPEVLDRNKEREAEAYLHTHLMMQCLKVINGNDTNNRKLRR
jgi:hypothetical protein